MKFKIGKEVKEGSFNLFLLLFRGFFELKYFYKVRILVDFMGFKKAMVPEVGLEPTQGCPYQILSLARLPVSPLGLS